MKKSRILRANRVKFNLITKSLRNMGIAYTYEVMGHANPTYTLYFNCGWIDYIKLKRKLK